VPSSFADFRKWALLAAVDATMPHALQTTREFWLSPAPDAFESYLRSIGQAMYADILGACGPGNVVTLDPHLIAASAAPL
jgi:hypothetical protein